MNERSRSFLLPRLGSRRHRIPQDLSHQHAAWRVAFPVHRRPDAPSMPPTLPQGWPLPSSPGPAGCFHPEPPPKARARLAPANHLLPKALPRGQVTFWSLSHHRVSFSFSSPPPWLRGERTSSRLRLRPKTHHCPQLSPASTHLTGVRPSAAETRPAGGASPARSGQLLGAEQEDCV